MATEREFGFAEIRHTADWALKVWAPDLALLFVQAAEGMYWLMETSLQPEPRVERTLDLEGLDDEMLLVAFLSELLYLGETEGLGFDHFEVRLESGRIHALLRGAPIVQQRKEIKAVTYHNLAIEKISLSLISSGFSSRGLSSQVFTVTIVFDV